MGVMAVSLVGRDPQHVPPYSRRMVDDMEARQKWAYALREAMKARDVTQEELADRLHKSVSTIQRWATGVSIPSVLEIPPMAEALGVQPIYFVTPPEPQPYPVRDFLVEVTAEAAAEGRERSNHRGRGPKPPARPRIERRRQPRHRNTGE